jgi:hypothetical protein
VPDNPVIPQQLTNKRSDDFASVYSNNVLFEGSVWDLKMIFGELDQANGIVDQHTSVTIPWPVAKLLIYHLRAQVMGFEIANGKIAISASVLPPEIQPPPDQVKDDPKFKEAYESLKKLREDFIKNL